MSNALNSVASEKALYEVIAPHIGGAELSDGTLAEARQKIDGGPSVLYDVVVVLLSAEGAAVLARDAAAQDFVRDAFGHCKFIAYTAESEPLFKRAGILDDLDAGCFEIAAKKDVATFLDAAKELRYWPREMNVDLDADAVR